ncbi:uncharacterized protein FIBRA_01043 [Fibroporia radiculosa]|uniref:T6SS Phospholipase effector Tle1-like catalytic domain-containing protein n=1 Tax=Fibroporia radiculosa TaxID=599839 RepID=J4H0W0_9APHY|nr:uncharacterized protein FIBRA_01043 [Fibroporia radiculosa]CCL99034.1 predicted protein [Fibroporia radiculosa]
MTQLSNGQSLSYRGSDGSSQRTQSTSSSPQRSGTYPLPHDLSVPKTSMKKRIIVCCDGTWQDGVIVTERWKYTNVLRLARAINHVDVRCDVPISQIVYYQSGVGSSLCLYDEVVDGATGATLGEKVEEAYAFIAHNYHPGDEIFLFGFSRGAFTARTIASFIGEIGVLDRTQMDHFGDIFIAFQKRGKPEIDAKENEQLDKILAPWTGHDAPGKRRADSSPHSFSIKCVGVFDTVGSVGLPEELTRHKNMNTLFGFHDTCLGEHIERAYQALALNEMRMDFDCAKFEQTEPGRLKGQVLKQCWFTGCHSDIGGGYHKHDLADITLMWMAANIGDILSLDEQYLASLSDPVAPWGEQPPHNSAVGIFDFARTHQREVPTATDNITHETIHPSVLHQDIIIPELARNIDANPKLVCSLLPLEEQLKGTWRVAGAHKQNSSPQALSSHEVCGLNDSSTAVELAGKPTGRKNWVACSHEETSLTSLVKALL